MNKPERIQLSRKKGFKLPANTVVVSRPSKWGNPFKPGINAKDITDAIHRYSEFIHNNNSLKQQVKSELKNKNLACWCKPGNPCHADILLKIANH